MIGRMLWCSVMIAAIGGVFPAWPAVPPDSAGPAGRLEVTGNRFDIAIDGDGFIEVIGPKGQVLLWRGGTLRMDDTGMLATQHGYPLRAEITVPVDSTRIEINGDGEVRSLTWDGVVTIIGQILLAISGPSLPLQRIEGGFFVATNPAALQHVRPGTAGGGALVQGSIERQ
jgi:flagellar basal-body rod protein FlgG